jgi:hypothetical protein
LQEHRIVVPQQTAAGAYSLAVGAYTGSDGHRLAAETPLTAEPNEPVTDPVPIAILRVQE